MGYQRRDRDHRCKEEFLISDDQTSRRRGTVDYLGLDLVAHTPTNAIFSVDGKERSSYSNTVSVGNAFELTLKAPQAEGDPPVRIGLKADLEALTDNINNLAGAYNDFIRRASEYTTSYGRSNRFMFEMASLTRQYTSALDAVGLNMQADGTISVDKDLLTQSASEKDPKESLDVVQRFTNALVNKTSQVTIDPMQYADQVIVAYKNPGKNFPNPYVPSLYSGMMFSSYC